MSIVPTSPYNFGGSSSGASKGPGIGKSIGDAIDAISGIKAHQATLEHLANEGQKNHERNLETIRLNHDLGQKAADKDHYRAARLEASRSKNTMAEHTHLVKTAQTLSKGAKAGSRMSVKPGAIDFTVGEKPAPKTAAKKPAAPKTATPKTGKDNIVKPVLEQKTATKRTK